MAGDLVVTTERPVLDAVRHAVDGADEVLMCVAFVHARGVNLVSGQLPRRGPVRLLATTAFGTTTSQGLALAGARGATVRILNPSGGSTYHPKLYLGRHGGRTRAVVGSANLTGGLVVNVESAVLLEGESERPELATLWTAAEGWWADPRTQPAVPGLAIPAERMPLDLLARIEQVLRVSDTVHTVSDHRPNRVTAVTDDGVYVMTTRSAEPKLVPAWMLAIAWEWLAAHGELTNAFLLADRGLNVKRSSFVCALFAAFEDVDVTSRRPVRLRLADASVALAAEPPAPYDPQPDDTDRRARRSRRPRR